MMAPPPAVAPPSVQSQGNGGGAAGFPYQQNTTPMAMPPRVVSMRAQQPVVHDEVTALPTYARSRMEATALVRPQARPTGLMIGAGVAVLLLLGSILFLMPRNGQIAVNVSDSKGGAVKNLQVSVDGKVQCDSAPCLVHNLAAGSHTVKVEAAGYEPLADRAVAVESGKDQAVDFLATPLAPSGGTGVKVAGGQPGEKLYVDDREVGALPQEIRDLTPGTHRVRVAGGDRYAAVERSVTVAKDEFQDLGTVTLKVIKGRATVSLMTPGAKVFLVSGSDRRELPTLPMSIDLDPSKQWSLVATKPGYADFTQALSFDDGQAEKSFVVTLDPRTASPTAGSMSFSPPPQTYSPPPYVPHTAPPPAPPSHPAPPPAAAGGGGEGTLNMNSIPASSVVLDGKPLGSTPQIGITVSAGTHTVLFVNADQGFKKQVSVTVAAGETKKVHP
jgi:serine/threonine-protein kinase